MKNIMSTIRNTCVNIGLNRRFFIIFSIVFAGEMIFSLPFQVARFFRPTLLDVFNITNTQLGDIIALYGVTAVLAYFPGGAIADRFSGRRLMSFSLFATALGGLYYTQIPSHEGLAFLYAYWGVTTIFLFWASMIKVTRQWGGETTQGKAFGILDGGRGLVSAAVASIAVFILSMLLPENTELMSVTQHKNALQAVISFYSLMTMLAGILILLALPKDEAEQHEVTRENNKSIMLERVFTVIKQPKIWLQALIVLSAYSAYKSLDYFGIYATTVLGLNELESARLVSNATYLRPIAAITAGFIADKLRADRVITWCFALLAACYLLLSFSGSISTSSSTIIEINFLMTFLLVFALRGIYFALLEESKLSGQLTGTAVGMISVIGYTPDIFFSPVAGRILDSTKGIDGFNQLFLLLIGISMIGFFIAYTLAKQIAKKSALLKSEQQKPELQREFNN